MSRPSLFRRRTVDAAPVKARPKIVPLLLALVALAAVWIAVNVGTIRSYLLGRQSLSTLRSAALQPDADPLTRRMFARRLVAAGLAAEAVPLLQGLVRELPPGATGSEAQGRLAELAHALALSNNPDEAQSVLEQAQKLDARDMTLLLTSGWIDLYRRQLDKAETTAKVLTEARPDEAEAWRLLGAICNARRSSAAIAPLRKSIALAPEVAATHSELGNALAFQGQYAQAAVEFRRAMKLDPIDPVYRHLLGEALAIAGRTPDEYREARTLLAEAVEAEPGNVTTLYRLAQLDLRSDLLDEARAHLRQTLDRRPGDSEVWYFLWYVERRRGDAAAAAAAMAQFRTWGPRDDAVQITQARVATQPADAGRRLALARAYRLTGNPVGAYWQLRAAQQMGPRLAVDPALKASIEADYAAHRKSTGDAPDDPNKIGPPPIGGKGIAGP